MENTLKNQKNAKSLRPLAILAFVFNLVSVLQNFAGLAVENNAQGGLVGKTVFSASPNRIVATVLSVASTLLLLIYVLGKSEKKNRSLLVPISFAVSFLLSAFSLCMNIYNFKTAGLFEENATSFSTVFTLVTNGVFMLLLAAVTYESLIGFKSKVFTVIYAAMSLAFCAFNVANIAANIVRNILTVSFSYPAEYVALLIISQISTVLGLVVILMIAFGGSVRPIISSKKAAEEAVSVADSE